MTKMYREQDVNREVFEGKTTTVLGYGSQGRAHALNLRESGFKVRLGLRPEGRSWKKAQADGWEPMPPGEAVVGADLVAILVPDMAQAALYKDYVAPNLKPGAALLFAHGFNVHFKHIEPPKEADVIMVAPKSPGDLVRRQYQEGRGVPCLIAIDQDASGQAFDRALAYADGLGGTKAGVLQTTFAEETETDLFGEQAVLCGGVTELIRYGYETLVEAGYQPEAAYFECLHELKLIVDLIYEGGFTKMHEFVSETAKYGDLTRGPRVVDASVKANMKEVLTEIQNGTFANEWRDENAQGLPRYKELLNADLDHPIEKVGKELRAAMAWLKPQMEGAK